MNWNPLPESAFGFSPYSHYDICVFLLTSAGPKLLLESFLGALSGQSGPKDYSKGCIVYVLQPGSA